MSLSRLLMLFLICLPAAGSQAQSQTYLSLQTATTDIQTGQEYEITIHVDAVPSLWLASVQISYDPQRLYIMGAKSGSPVKPGGWFPVESAIVINNFVTSQNTLDYSLSQLAPADPLSGSGVIGTFRVYPLAPGPTVLGFRQANLRTVTITNTGGTREPGEPETVPFAPVLLQLNISGDPVEPPAEITATPELTVTSQPGSFDQPVEVPTLANLAALPTLAATSPALSGEIPAIAGDDRSSLIALAAGVIGLAVLGLGGLIVLGRRKAAQ